MPLPAGHPYQDKAPNYEDSTLMYLDIGASNAIGTASGTVYQSYNSGRDLRYKHDDTLAVMTDQPNNQGGDSTYPNLNEAGTQNRNCFLVPSIRETLQRKVVCVQGGKSAVGITNQITGFNSPTVMGEIEDLCAAARLKTGAGFSFAIVNVTDGDSKFGTTPATLGGVFDDFCDNLRNAAGNPDLPIIMVGLGEDTDPVTYPSWTAHREYFKTEYTADNFYFVQTDDLLAATYCEADGIHWNATGQKVIAGRILQRLKAESIIPREKTINVHLSGQSNAGNLANSTESGSSNGIDTVGTTIQNLAPQVGDVSRYGFAYYAGHDGGSGSTEDSNAVEYWWHDGNDERGVELQDYFEGSETRADYIYHDLVATDANYAWTVSEYKAIQEKIFTEMWAVHPTAKIMLRSASRRPSLGNAGGYQVVREAQWELANEYDDVFLSPETFDLDLYDTVHNTDAAIAIEGERLGRYIAFLEGFDVSGSVVGMEMESATRDGTSVTVTLSHDGGTGLNLTTGIEGFKFFDDSSEITINSATSDGVDTVTLTLASTPTGVETLYYGYDAMTELDNSGAASTNILKDNSPQVLPLRTGKIVL